MNRETSMPVIGICARTMTIPVQGRSAAVSLAAQSHADLLAEVGCIPVMIPMSSAIGSLTAAVDGLLLPGGPDVNPARYGAQAHPRTQAGPPAWDEAELAVIERALADELPLVAICRGMQLLNVQRGGSLHQHLPEVIGHDGHFPEGESFTLGRQRLQTEPGSQVAAMFSGETPEVACHHHQGISQLGAGLLVTARAPDGVVEAIEVSGHPFAVGVQWEPDETADDRLYRALAAAARHASPRAAAHSG